MAATADLRGRTVLEVVSRGKHLLTRLDDGRTLHTHLRMEGSWRIEGGGSPAAASALRRRDLRVALGTAEWTTLGLRLGEVDLVASCGYRDDFPADFFNTTARNGAVFTTPGSGFRNDSTQLRTNFQVAF